MSFQKIKTEQLHKLHFAQGPHKCHYWIYREREREIRDTRKKHGKNALSQAHILSPHQQPLHIFLSGESTHAMLQKKPKTVPWGHHSCQSQPQVFKNYHQELWTNHMGVSKNRGTPKSSILIGVSVINHPFWGKHPYFWKHPYVASISCIMSWLKNKRCIMAFLEFGHWNQPEVPEWNPLPVEKCK